MDSVTVCARRLLSAYGQGDSAVVVARMLIRGPDRDYHVSLMYSRVYRKDQDKRRSLHMSKSSSIIVISGFRYAYFDCTCWECIRRAHDCVQTGKDEVVLRRTIGSKKDDYSLDKKSVTLVF